MSFEFYKYANGNGTLVSEKRLSALSSYHIWKGAALKITGGVLAYAETADVVYAISNCSAASSVVTAGFVPEVFPVHPDQVWRVTIGNAITAATVPGSKININLATHFGTSVHGGAAGTALYVYDVVTGTSEYGASCAFVQFLPDSMDY